MEKDSPSKPSVAELAGRFKGHILPMPSSNDEMTRRPPCFLKLQHQKNDHEESDTTAASPNPFKVKTKNAPNIEKLQANLALSPSALLPSPKTPEVKLQLAPLSPTEPCGALSATPQPSQQSAEDEDPISFDDPPEGAALHSINKTRPRLSFKRRPPTRQHRRSASEETGALGSSLSPCELSCPKENGDQDQVFDRTAEEGEHRHAGGPEEEDVNGDCEKTEDEEAKSDPGDTGDVEEEEQTSGQAQSLEALEEEQPPPEQIEGDVTAEENQEEMVQEAARRRRRGVNCERLH
ncbi:hypothetical protein Q5P01_009699 [Channa striata]|uniref:FAM21/CAPZIP domain-containing protein n=1 Tax=Channa striata TaxID=64152 RepID=A0AA88SSI0_CHASR|nr:hypothetical protein Q5P01_009699 [Channa striata]